MQDRSRQLRKDQTDAERRLWVTLRGRRFRGLKFRRQVEIGGYIVDFCCFERRLVVEVDGGQHDVQRICDAYRTKYLEDQGFRVFRFWNGEVMNQLEVVLSVLDGAVRGGAENRKG